MTHWLAVNHVLRYVRGTLDKGLLFNLGSNPMVKGFADADYANDKDDRRSVTGYLFTFGGAAISWRSRRQRSVALSTTEAEYMSISDCSRHAVVRHVGAEKLKEIIVHHFSILIYS